VTIFLKDVFVVNKKLILGSKICLIAVVMSLVAGSYAITTDANPQTISSSKAKKEYLFEKKYYTGKNVLSSAQVWKAAAVTKNRNLLGKRVG
jgi:hypothetical protein